MCWTTTRSSINGLRRHRPSTSPASSAARPPWGRWRPASGRGTPRAPPTSPPGVGAGGRYAADRAARGPSVGCRRSHPTLPPVVVVAQVDRSHPPTIRRAAGDTAFVAGSTSHVRLRGYTVGLHTILWTDRADSGQWPETLKGAPEGPFRRATSCALGGIRTPGRLIRSRLCLPGSSGYGRTERLARR